MSLTPGSATIPTNKSTQTFVTALVTGLIFLGIYLFAFIAIRNLFPKIYQPRSSRRVAPSQRVDPLPHSLLGWIPAVLRADSRQIIEKNGLDAYVFVRFLWLMMEIFLPFTILTFLIILPVDAVNSDGTNTGILMFTFGNVGLNNSPRYAAHLVVVWILTFYVFYLVKRELGVYVVLRQDFLMSPGHSRLAQSKTVLVTGVPKEFLSVEALTKFCSVLPGGVKRIWLARNLGELPDLYDRRIKATKKLEGAETALLRKVAKAILKNNKSKEKKKIVDAPTMEELEKDSTLYSRFVSSKNKPHHKLGFLGLWGKKVDTIDWAREEIATTTKALTHGHAIIHGPNAQETYPAESAAFIQFETQIAAHMFAQVLNHHAPLRMSARYLEVGRDDVIFGNLSVSPYQEKLRYVIGWAVTIGLIILWSFPVAFVGLLSNVSSLCISYKWLAWLCKLPTPINGIIQGSLPPVALALLFLFLPIILRLIARFQGIPLRTQIELSLMTRYFLFLVIHGFLIVTLSSGLVAAIPAISKDPGSAVTLLATKLPAASTFFLTYFVTTSFGGASGSLLQIVTLILYYVKLFILGSTPRSVYGIKFGMNNVQWGTLFPNMTLLTVIGITYSVIAPLVAGFAFLAFALFWFAYKYLFLWVLETKPSSETGGLFYPKALTHIFVGLYIEEVCLAGLFFLAQDDNNKPSAIPQGALMVVLIVFTILFQLTMNSGYQPLISYLPLSLAGRMVDIQAEIKNANTEHQNGISKINTYEKDDHESNLTPRGSPEFPPAPRKSDDGRAGLTATTSNDDGSEPLLEAEEFVDRNAFNHPATYEAQRVVWIPADQAGIYRQEVADTRAAGVEISTEGALMDARGRVDVRRSPPGDKWDDGMDSTIKSPLQRLQGLHGLHGLPSQ